MSFSKSRLHAIMNIVYSVIHLSFTLVIFVVCNDETYSNCRKELPLYVDYNRTLISSPMSLSNMKIYVKILRGIPGRGNLLRGCANLLPNGIRDSEKRERIKIFILIPIFK